MVTKQAIKNYLELSNKDLAEKLKSTIENSDNWSSFKSDLIDLLLTYDKNPNPENKAKIDSLISRNYISNNLDAKDALDKILADLKIGQEKNLTPKAKSKNNGKINANKEAYLKKLYEDLGFEYDIGGKSQESSNDRTVSSEEIENFRKKYHSNDKFFRAKSKRTENEDKSKDKTKDNKPDGKIKRTLKLAYFKLTASMLIAPGKVPPEILSKNKALIDDASKKLDALIEGLKEDKEAIFNDSQSQEEAEITQKMMLAEEIHRQLLEIKDIVKQYDDKEKANGTLDKDDSKKRELALKIARRKVKVLEKAKLSKVIELGEKNSKGVINRAKGILLPHLENAKYKDLDRFEKTFNENEQEQSE